MCFDCEGKLNIFSCMLFAFPRGKWGKDLDLFAALQGDSFKNNAQYNTGFGGGLKLSIKAVPTLKRHKS